MEVDLTNSMDEMSDDSLPALDFLTTTKKKKDNNIDVVTLSDDEGESQEQLQDNNVLDDAINELPASSNYVYNCDSQSSEDDCASGSIFARLRAESVAKEVKKITSENVQLQATDLVKETNSLGNVEKYTKLKDPERKKQRKEVKDVEREKKKEADRQLKQIQAEARQAAKTEKLLEKEREKMLKKIEHESHRNSKPDQSIKLMKVIIDERLIDLPVGSVLLSLLETAEINFEICEQPVPFCITWNREIMESQLSLELQIEQNKATVKENEVLIYLPTEKFLDLVNIFKQKQMGNYSQEETIISYSANIKQLLNTKTITILVEGCDKYFKSKKTAAQRKFRATVLDEQVAQKKRKKKNSCDDFELSEIDVEEAVVALQIEEKCNVYFVESAADIASTIITFTKAIAAAPFRRAKYENKLYLNINTDNYKTAKVKNSGDGLLALWQQQLETFNLVSSDVAQAISAKYPSPSSLLQAYKNCMSTNEKQRLLQDIAVRRGAGPLATTRRVGPELSRKIFLYFTSTNPNLNLNSS